MIPKFLERAIHLNDLCIGDKTSTDTATETSRSRLETQIEKQKEVEKSILFGLRNSGKSKKARVGEGFVVVSSKDDFLMMEKKLDGKFGSYRIFEK